MPSSLFQRTRFTIGVASLLCSITPVSALAQAQAESSEAAVEARRDEAKLSFQRGVELYRAGQYEAAVKSFLEADRLAPSPALSFNIARAYERLEDVSGALRWYRDYLRRSPSAKNTAEVRARVAELSAKLARSGLQQLTVLSTPTGASVIIDGRPVGITPFSGDLKPGKHHVQLELAGYEPIANDALLQANAPLELDLTLARDRRPSTTLHVSSDPAPGEPGPQRDEAGGRRFGAVPWVMLGAGAASLGVATGFELARRGDEKDAQAADSQVTFKTELDSMEKNQTRARVFAGIGAGLLLGGGVMLVFNQKVGPARSDASLPLPGAPRLALGCSAGGCAALASGGFQ